MYMAVRASHLQDSEIEVIKYLTEIFWSGWVDQPINVCVRENENFFLSDGKKYVKIASFNENS